MKHVLLEQECIVPHERLLWSEFYKVSEYLLYEFTYRLGVLFSIFGPLTLETTNIFKKLLVRIINITCSFFLLLKINNLQFSSVITIIQQ